MKSIRQELSDRVVTAIAAIGAEGDPLVAPSQDRKFGDYQCNGAMGLARRLEKKPRDVAEAIIEQLDVEELCEPPHVAGPGFINFRLKPAYLARCLGAIPALPADREDRLGIDPFDSPEVVVVDLSSPNLAKEMHVGHLRTTVIGDFVARLLEFQGHTVHRENHVGDWGTQFGMLVAYLRLVRPEVVDNPDRLVIKDLESFYVQAKALFDSDDAFKKESRETVVALQQGDPATRRIWKAFCDESLRHCHEIYDRLDICLEDRGESAYADLMGEVVRRLERLRDEEGAEFVQESDGALCLFLPGFKTRDGEPLPVIVRKSDGGFNYAASDLATIIDRVERLKAKRIIYVVGIAQKQHFQMVFAAARKARFVSDDVALVHLAFGNILRADGQPFKTREGGAVKLKDLLDEAVQRARQTVERQMSADEAGRRAFTEEQIEVIAQTVGLGAVKYYDMARSLQGDYKFEFDAMCSLEGNTAPYMMYAYARICSIGHKAGVDFASLGTQAHITLEHPAEIALGLKLLQFSEALDATAADLKPNVLTDYLYELARTFSRFYDKKIGVRVVDATPESLRRSRLRLCDLTARTLKLGLNLLGIKTVEQM
ncbi:MAG: arginine--tRNA ligase [Phycisphaerae bacterium]